MDVSIFLLHTDDVGRMIRFVLFYLVLVEGEEAKLEEIFDDDGDLEGQQHQCQRSFPDYRPNEDLQ